MVLASIHIHLDPQRLDEVNKAVLDCERGLRAGGRCRQWVVTETGPGQYTSMCFYDNEEEAQKAITEVMQCLRAFGSAMLYFAHRVIHNVVVEHRF